jgi:hypothetical protein
MYAAKRQNELEREREREMILGALPNKMIHREGG